MKVQLDHQEASLGPKIRHRLRRLMRMGAEMNTLSDSILVNRK